MTNLPASNFRHFSFRTLPTPDALAHMLGFEDVFDRMTMDIESKYPPFNVIKTDDTHYEIEMAVAGFSDKDIDIQYSDGVLTVKGKVEADTSKVSKNFIHQGIATRSFTRSFTLDKFLKIDEAEIENGILKIKVYKEVPEELKPKKISISKKD